MTGNLTIQVRDPDRVENIQNAIGHVEEELAADVHRDRGRPPTDAITRSRAIEELAIAYAGIDLSEVDDD